MARPCPACGRPNRDTATNCLYCVEPLPPAEPAAAAPIAPAPAASSRRHLLILIPSNGPEDHLVSELSRITAIPLYDARLFLSSGRPRLFRFVDDEGEARRLSKELAHAKLAHYVVSEESVLALPVARASRLDLRERHLEVRLEGRERASVSLPYTDVILLVRGEIARERQDENRFGTMRNVSRRLTPGLRLHLYGRDAAFAIEIDPDAFDWELLESDRGSSAVLNFEKLVSRLSAVVESANLDSGFDYEPVVVSKAKEGADVTDALSETDRGPAGALYDNEASFRFYSRWRYRVERHLSFGESG